jgi:hypothetical protein
VKPAHHFSSLDVSGVEVKEIAPLPRVLGSSNLSGGSVNDRELPVSEQSMIGNFG